ncbi:MAG: tRNA preQ1(34) S-adenosylmethionine ribosyltransferase-isomerase QueA [Bacteroidales bacterium]|nr:tRNA preQ1(34) S-adenosylmethionine ribosyltransferase-isomerase QueA [Bacteroidales bacterium]MDE7072028.1 tRNA preQ1(34) S-adenosylmethionine ribosyltransferase-isomerase QueA [Bacteroidales bacterium]
MKLSQFNYQLPADLIATHPTPDRDDCKLMVVDRKKQKIEHKVFKDILKYFDEDDVFIMNDTRVFPARLSGEKEKTGAMITVFLLRELNRESLLWDVYVDPARKIRIGNKLYFGDNDELVAEVIDNTTSRGRTLRFLYDGSYENFKALVYKLGQTPVPDHILQVRNVEPEDEERYQTVFAAKEGAVMAPTAGLHFSRSLLKRMEIKGINTAFLTLHCGLGNVREIDVEDLTKHRVDSEKLIIPEHTAQIVNKAIEGRKKVCAVGTSVMKGIESSVSFAGTLKPYDGWTNKFIFPPYDFTIANCMISNFHAPLSSLFMSVCAFGGYDLIMKAYQEAIEKKYRFLTFGDAMLIL